MAASAVLFAQETPEPAAGQTAVSRGESPEDDFLDFGEDSKGVTLTETPEVTQQMRVIAREEIERRNARDLSTLLEDALDMSVTRYGATETKLNSASAASTRNVSPSSSTGFRRIPPVPANLT
jgi:hypothetical protein